MWKIFRMLFVVAVVVYILFYMYNWMPRIYISVFLVCIVFSMVYLFCLCEFENVVQHSILHESVLRKRRESRNEKNNTEICFRKYISENNVEIEETVRFFFLVSLLVVLCSIATNDRGRKKISKNDVIYDCESNTMKIHLKLTSWTHFTFPFCFGFWFHEICAKEWLRCTRKICREKKIREFIVRLLWSGRGNFFLLVFHSISKHF